MKKKHVTSRRRPWKFPVTAIFSSILILAGVATFMYPHVASWFSQFEQSRVIGLELVSVGDDSEQEERIHEEIQRAQEYNESLASGAIYQANANIASGRGELKPGALNYNDLLNSTGSGYMGRLFYGSLDIDLPIYHGTETKTLEIGIGHLEGTSLPVGGKGTRSVLTAHRGLPEATLFNELDKAKEGDIFTITIFDKVYAYQVQELKVIAPEDTQEIEADPERDLVTLVTCTPLGINTHRILVTAQRIYPTPEGAEEAAKSEPRLPHFPWWIIILTVTVLGVAVYIWRDGYRAAEIVAANKIKETE
ncbi:class C sortase [Arcanobacterium phocisimile]|uniref:Class C sortase n=1 Tax=Arcanobacterium phocisimile TaxID=1302235 RepID=A0ABX7IGM3_9ACTO|nr:class C sortase [Arcanobacterium phocisimile]QRV02269.1 class C sortase [Arcanobacterium phocisimile]